jgi:hypothetical protein
MAREIISFKKNFEGKAGQGYVINPSSMILPVEKDVMTLQFTNLWRLSCIGLLIRETQDILLKIMTWMIG